MTRLFRLLILVFVFGGVFQVLVHAQEVIWCVSQDEQATVHIRKTDCETGERQISSQTIASWPALESYDLTLGVLIGIGGAVLVNHLQRKHEREIQGVDIFWRYRKEAFDNQALRNIMEQGELSKEEDIKIVVDFYEEVCLHVNRKLIDLHLLDEVLGDYIIKAYRSPNVEEWIKKIKEEDDSYYENFYDIGKKLSDKAEERSKKTKKRG